jgi:RNase adaptor protein for sRNA GlmZ degradation
MSNQNKFFDEHNYHQELKQCERMKDATNQFLEEAEASFNFSFDSIQELSQLLAGMNRHGHQYIVEAIYQRMPEPELGGFRMTKQVALDSIEVPDTTTLLKYLRDVRAAVRESWNQLQLHLELENNRAYIPETTYHQLQERFTVEAKTKTERRYMAALNDAANAISELESAAADIDVKAVRPTIRNMSEYVRDGAVDAQAFYLLKQLQKQSGAKV